jgi:iron complex outermembrane receptor protein
MEETAIRTRIARNGNKRALAIAAMSVMTMGAGASGSPAHASIAPETIASAVRTYRIPAGSMTNALNTIADMNDLQLLYDAGVTQRLKSKALRGRYSVTESLDRLLEGTGLTYHLASKRRTVSIHLAENDTETQSDAAPVGLPTIDVNGGGPGGPNDPTAYSVPNTVTATKTNTPIMQTPVSIRVVPQQVLQDQQVVIIDQALQNVSGVYPLAAGEQLSGFTIRGFETLTYYLDGVPVGNRSTPATRETVDLQRVEVLKGPASILYGRLEPGGLINLVTKQPSATPYYAVQQQFGSFGFYRTTFNATGPVTSDNSLLYRIDGAYQNSDSFAELAFHRRVFLAPKLHWEPTQDTQVNGYLQFFSGRDSLTSGIPIFANAPAPVPISRNYGERGTENNTNYDIRVGFNWTHSFNPDWALKQRFDADFRDEAFPAAALASGVDPSNCTLVSCPIGRTVIGNVTNTQFYYTNLELTGHVDTFGLSHTLLAGGDYYVETRFKNNKISFQAPPIDLFNPIHSGNLAYLLQSPDYADTRRADQNWYGLYLQDQVTLPYNIHLLAGFRYDNASVSATTLPYFPSSGSSLVEGHGTAVKPRFGLLWQPIPQLSFYGNYVQNFGLPTNTGNPLAAGPGQTSVPASVATQWEAGMKTDLLDGHLSTTVAWFDITKNNVATPASDPVLAALGFQVLTGVVRNRGFEFDTSGQLLPEVKVIGSFAYIDSKILQDNSGNVGHRLFGVPAVGGSFWAVYEPLWEPVRGLALGAGFVARGNRYLDNTNTISLASYTTVNLMARHAFTAFNTKCTFQLNVDNLLDKHYFIGNDGNTAVQPGVPRTILGALKLEF